jgi:enoyl-CoA hydratase/carnithine racemase
VTWGEIKIGIQELYDDPEVKVIIITGAGGKAFASEEI